MICRNRKRCNKKAHVWSWNLNWWSKTTAIVDLKTKELKQGLLITDSLNGRSKRYVRMTGTRCQKVQMWDWPESFEPLQSTLWGIQKSVDCGFYTLPTKKKLEFIHTMLKEIQENRLQCRASTYSFCVWGRNGLEHVANRFSSEIFGGWGGWMRIFTCLPVYQ